MASTRSLTPSGMFVPERASLFLQGELPPTLVHVHPPSGYVRFEPVYGVFSVIKHVNTKMGRDGLMPVLDACMTSPDEFQRRLVEICEFYGTLQHPMSTYDAYLLMYCEAMEGGPARWLDAMKTGNLVCRVGDGPVTLFTCEARSLSSLENVDKDRNGWWKRPTFLANLAKELTKFRRALHAENQDLDPYKDDLTVHEFTKILRVTNAVIYGVAMDSLSCVAGHLCDTDWAASFETVRDAATVERYKVHMAGIGFNWQLNPSFANKPQFVVLATGAKQLATGLTPVVALDEANKVSEIPLRLGSCGNRAKVFRVKQLPGSMTTFLGLKTRPRPEDTNSPAKESKTGEETA